MAGSGTATQSSAARPRIGGSLLEQIVANASGAMFVRGADGRYLAANEAYASLFGREIEILLGRRPEECFAADIAQRMLAEDAQVLAKRAASDFETENRVRGELRTLLARKFPLLDENGTPYAVCGIVNDVTSQRRSEEAMRRAALAVSSADSDAVFRELVRYLATILGVEVAFIATFNEGSPYLGMLACYMDGDITESFDYPIRGTPCETVVGQRYRAYPSNLETHFAPYFASGVGFAALGLASYAGFPLNDRAGKPLGIISVASRSPIANPEMVESILTIFAARAGSELERKRANEALRRSDERYRAIFNATADALVLCDEDCRIVDVNPEFLAMCGHDRAEVTSPNRIVTPLEDRLKEKHAQALAGNLVQYETQCAQGHGSAQLDLEVRGVPMEHEGKPHVLYVVRDITARRQAERRRLELEGQLRQAQKMEAIGHLTGGIAHDFNNILTSVVGYIVLAAERSEDAGDTKLARYLGQAQQAAERARELVQQMMTFSRAKRGEPRPVALAALVRDEIGLLRSTMPATIELKADLEDDAPAIEADPVQIQQVLLNLAINARDAMNSSGLLRIDVRTADHSVSVCASCGQAVRGRMVELLVGDSGPGIRPEVRDRMFEPFFTTKEIGKGSGMGLATVHGIVHEHGGHLVVDSQPGRGARFHVLFPALEDVSAAANPGASGPQSPRLPKPRLRGRVLVVEDEVMVGQFMRDLLEDWGLDVALANDPLQVEPLLCCAPDRIDLVITDLTMPHMTGLDLAHRIAMLQPSLPVLLYTGYGEQLSDADLERAKIRGVIKKPVAQPMLLRLLEAHLPKIRNESGRNAS